MSFTSTQLQESSLPSFYLAKKTAMCAPKQGRVYTYQTLGPRERNSPVTNTAVKELRKRVSYIIPSFNLVLERAQTQNVIQFFLGGPPTCFFPSWTPRWGPHSGSRFGATIYKLAECVSSFVRLTTLLLPECLLGDFWFLFCHESFAWCSAYISSRSWPMPCASTAPSKRLTSAATRSAMRDLRFGGWSDVECLREVVWEWIRAECYFSSRAGQAWEVTGFDRCR